MTKTALKFFIVLVICITSLICVESKDSAQTEPQNNKKSGKSNKKNKRKQKKIKVDMVEIDFNVPEVLTVEPTAMVELVGGEFDFGSQFHFDGEKVTSPKVRSV